MAHMTSISLRLTVTWRALVIVRVMAVRSRGMASMTTSMRFTVAWDAQMAGCVMVLRRMGNMARVTAGSFTVTRRTLMSIALVTFMTLSVIRLGLFAVACR